MASTPRLPLEGIKVLDVTLYLFGPSASCILGEWGADVIHIEDTKGGDASRGISRRRGLHVMREDYNYYWQFANRNKRSLAIDLASEQGKEVLYKLVEQADVLVTNFRPKTFKKLGIDYETISKINPQIIYAVGSAYGPNGPDKNKPGFDEIAFWIRSGIMSIVGEPNTNPVPLRGAMGDLSSGCFLASGVVLALLARERFGFGQRVDVSLMGSGMWIGGWDVQEVLSTGQDVEKRDRKRMGNPIYNTYQTKDGKWLQFVMLQTDRYWPDLCKVLEREDLAQDPRFDTHEKRCDNSELIISILDKVLATKTLDEWTSRLNQYDLPWDREVMISEVLADPQVRENDYVVKLDHPAHGEIKLVSTPIHLSKTPLKPRFRAPEYAEHTEEILLEAGYSWDDISRLKEKGVIL